MCRCRRACSICCAALSPISAWPRSSLLTTSPWPGVVAAHDGDEGGQVVETGLTDRVLDVARALHSASRIVDIAGVTMATPLVVSQLAKSFVMHLRDGVRRPVIAGVSFRSEPRMRGPWRSVRSWQSAILKMLYGTTPPRRPDHRRSRRPVDRYGQASPRTSCRSGAPPFAMSASSCAPCRASRPSLWWPSRCLRAAKSEAGTRVRASALLGRLNFAGEAVGAASSDLLRRRAAAREHRARLHHPASVLLLDEPTHRSTRRTAKWWSN